MYTAIRITRTWSVVGAAALACACFAGKVVAKEHIVTVSVPVNSQGLDLTKLDDARTFYIRLQNAAWLVCTRGTRVNLAPVADFRGCYEKALGDAVRTARTPLVTHLYLATHSMQQAADRGIELPEQVAVK